MPHPQFSLKSVFVVMTLVASAIAFGHPYWHRFAPAWGTPTYKIIDDGTAEYRYWTGRRHQFAIPRR